MNSSSSSPWTGGSTDASADAVGALARRDPRIRPLHLPHVSRGRALNEAAAVARGRWIWIVHDDNVIMPDCLATQLAFTQRTSVNICGVCALRSGSADGVMWRPESHEAICQDLFFHLAVLPTVLMATDIVRSNPFDEEACFEDYEFLTRLASRSRMGNVQLECLSQADPPALMRRMGERWHNACLRSAALGPACHSLDDEIAPAFGCLSKTIQSGLNPPARPHLSCWMALRCNERHLRPSADRRGTRTPGSAGTDR